MSCTPDEAKRVLEALCEYSESWGIRVEAMEKDEAPFLRYGRPGKIFMDDSVDTDLDQLVRAISKESECGGMEEGVCRSPHDCIVNGDCIQTPSIYSFETHGDGYALYLGRAEYMHGYNLANMKEVDKPRMQAMIDKLNGNSDEG